MGRRKKGEIVNGWVCLDKPYGLGSTDAVSKVRRLFNAQKAGHAGTLDPLASGILPIALGEATKTVAFMMEAQKVYRFSIEWGVSTDSIDREGQITGRSDARPDVEAVRAALPAFVGEIDQVPPQFSAIKVDGQRAYDLARDGAEFELASRRVMIHEASVSASHQAEPLWPDTPAVGASRPSFELSKVLIEKRLSPSSNDRSLPLRRPSGLFCPPAHGDEGDDNGRRRTPRALEYVESKRFERENLSLLGARRGLASARTGDVLWLAVVSGALGSFWLSNFTLENMGLNVARGAAAL